MYKRMMTVCFFCILFVCLTGCTPKVRDPYAYRQFPITAEILLHQSGNEIHGTLYVESPDIGSLSLTAPDTVAGYVFSLQNKEVTVSYGTYSYICRSDASLSPLIIELVDLFSISAEEAIVQGSDRIAPNGAVLTVDENGIPKTVTCSDYTADILLYTAGQTS